MTMAKRTAKSGAYAETKVRGAVALIGTYIEHALRHCKEHLPRTFGL